MPGEYDAVIVGAGFGAITVLDKLRKLGLKCRIVEKGARTGGIWYWNCYPGARVDSDAPIYQLFDKELWEDFVFRERYAGWRELRRYFDYLEQKLEINKDADFDTAVTGAAFDENTHKWTIKTSKGNYVARWFIPCIGFAAKKYMPPYKGIDNFEGVIEHTATWPQEGVDLVGKRIAVIGTGASGVQTIQECGKAAKQLTVYQRTPNYAIPMNQKPLSKDYVRNEKDSGHFNNSFKTCFETFAGFDYDFSEKNTFDDSPEERNKFYHRLLVEEGGFRYWLATYKDMLFDEKANREAYNFWRDSVRARINDPRKQEILAPMEPPHPWGTKRPSLEQDYYEVFNLPHVDIVDLQKDPIEEITADSIKTKSGKEQKVDVIALATGFDSVTGSLAQLDIRGSTGDTISDHWKDGLKTAMGIGINTFPNLFFLYGPQAPTAFSNGPSCVQVQAIWLEKLLKQLKEQGITRFEAKKEVEEDWARRASEIWASSLFPQAKSWYQGSNIPGKRVEPLNWAGGMPAYIKAIHESLDNNFQGWHVAK